MNEEQKKDLIKEFGLEGLPEESQAKVITAMTETLTNKITLRILEELSEEEREELEKVQESEDAEKTENFLKGKLPNYEGLVDEVVEDFKKETKEQIEYLKKGMEGK